MTTKQVSKLSRRHFTALAGAAGALALIGMRTAHAAGRCGFRPNLHSRRLFC